jgi:hypothetical protein
MKYQASFDRFVIIATSLLILLLGVTSYLILKIQPRDNHENAIFAFLFISFISLLIGIFLFSPRGYIITEEEIRITRSVKSISIKLVDIIDISIPDEKLMKNSGKAGGTGGIFGHFGNYYNKNFGGDMTWYATQLKKFVIVKVIKTKREYSGPNSKKIKVIVLTPDNYLEFFEDLKAKLYTKKTETRPS